MSSDELTDSLLPVRLLMQNHFSEEQKDRYEAFRRSGIKTASVRRVGTIVFCKPSGLC